MLPKKSLLLESEWKLRKSDCVLSKPDADQAVDDEFGAKKPQKPATWLGEGRSCKISSKICTVFWVLNQDLVKFSSVENLSD